MAQNWLKTLVKLKTCTLHFWTSHFIHIQTKNSNCPSEAKTHIPIFHNTSTGNVTREFPSWSVSSPDIGQAVEHRGQEVANHGRYRVLGRSIRSCCELCFNIPSNTILQTNFPPDTSLQTNYPPNMIRGGYFPWRPAKLSGKSNGNVEQKNWKAKAVPLFLRIWMSNHSKFKSYPNKS